jgi:hypothetical protein
MSAFRDNLARHPSGDDYQFFFHVRGNPGVGKTSLLRQWEAVAREQVAATVYLDDGVHSAVEAMAHDRLGPQGLQLRGFDKLLATLRQREHEAQWARGTQTPGEGGGARSRPRRSQRRGAWSPLGWSRFVRALAGAVDPQQIVQGADRLRAGPHRTRPIAGHPRDTHPHGFLSSLVRPDPVVNQPFERPRWRTIAATK